MAIIKKYPESLTQNLTLFQTYITDTAINSKYFKITEFKDIFTGGKNGFLIEGSEHLKESTDIKIEILDVNGNPVYYEVGNGIPEYYEGVSKLIAVYVYEDTPIGSAKITILGELKTFLDDSGIAQEIPEEWRNVYNIKWERDFTINKLLSNEDKVRFYRRPEVSINEIVKPIFSNIVVPVIQKGFVVGTAQSPSIGTPLSDYTLPTSYLLTTTDNSAWTGSIVGTSIELTDLGVSLSVDDVINKTNLRLASPYTVNGIVSDFDNTRYTASFNYVEGVDNLKTALTGSFAKILISDLQTFVGDVARVKIYRKSQSDLADYQFIQEIQLESNEILKDLESTTKNEEYYGIFDQFNFKNYWITSSNDLVTEFNQNFLFNSVKLNGNGANTYNFFTSKSIDVTNNTEYTLTFNSKLQQNLTKANYIKFFISGSQTSNNITKGVSQNILTLTSDNSLLQKSQITANFKAEQIDNAKLYIEVKGTGWYIADISLRASQESAFSPNEISFIQPIPRTLPRETFDFRFQFYDINNNYIPVLVEESKTFDGGNLNVINKELELIPSSLYFQFDSGSGFGNPIPPTTIFIDVVKSYLTGSVNFTSRSFDFFNNELSQSQYTPGQFPGLLLDRTLDTVRLTVENFTGSREDIPVQFIEFTGECEGVTDTIVITRVIDGKGGVNFELRPYRGTTIRNNDPSGSLEIQAIRIDGINEINLRAGLPSGRSLVQMHVLSGSNYLLLNEASASGFLKGVYPGISGSKEINYNATFNRDSIDGQRTIYLIPSSSLNYSASILTTLTLTDLLDGLDAGVFVYDNDTFTINPRLASTFTPPSASATASFYRRGTNLYPISASVFVFPSMSINNDFVPEYWMYYYTSSVNADISVVATDDNNFIVPSLPLGSYVRSPLSQSKTLTVTATYLEPYSSESVNVTKVFSIIPEGKPGDETIIFEVAPNVVNLNANSRGDVTSYSSSITDIKIKQGSRYLSFTSSRVQGTFWVAQPSITGSAIIPGVVLNSLSPTGFDANNTGSLRIGPASNMTQLSASVTYNLEIQPYYTSSVYTGSFIQQYNKTLEGAPPIQIVISPTSVAIPADEVGYVSSYANANTSIIVKEGDDFLTFTTQSVAPGRWRINSVETRNSSGIWNIRTGSLSSSSLSTATINYNRFDYPYVSASAVYTIQVYPFALGAGHQYTSSIFTRTQTFTKNVAPPNARSVDLKATYETVNFDRDGVVTAPLDPIILTATATNTSGAVWFQFYKDDTDYSGIVGEDSPNSKFATLEVGGGDITGPGENATWTVKIRDGNNSTTAPIRAQSSLTIVGIKAGADAYKLSATNENCSITGDLWEKSLTGTGIKITTFKGVNQLNNTSSYVASQEVYNYLGNFIGNLGFSSASIFSKPGFVTMSGAIGSPTGETKFPPSNPATIGDLYDWDAWATNSAAQIVYKVDYEKNRQIDFVTQSISVQFTPPAPYDVKMQNENSSIVYRVSGELEFGSSANIIRVYRGSQELTHKPSGWGVIQRDAYGNWGYKNQCQVEVYSKSGHITLSGGITPGGAPIPGVPATMPSIIGWVDPENNPTAEIVYEISCEGRQLLYKTQSLSIQFEGAVGPGIVMRGEWSNQTDYIGQVETTNNRRDAVIYNAVPGTTNYYASVSGSGPNTYVNPTTSTFYVGASPAAGFVLIGAKQPDTQTDYWEFLGQEEFFVAAKIAIFEESYVKNTINVGTVNGTGAFANIVIAGGRTDPYIAIGQNATVGTSGNSGTTLNPGGQVIGYSRPGIFLGIYEQPIGSGGTTGRFSIVNGAGDRYLKWNGSGLEIAGDITVTGGNAATQNAVSASIASGSATSIDVAAVQTAVAVNLLSGSLGAMAAISSINAGNATTFIGPGVVVANMFAGTAIQSTNFVDGTGGYASTGTFIDLAGSSIKTKGFKVDSFGSASFKGNLSGASGIFRDSVQVGTGSAGVSLLVNAAGTGSLVGPNFSLTYLGLACTDITMSGKVFATAGEIGNWEVDANQNLKDNQNRIFLNPNLPGIELKTAGVTELKINAGGITNLSGASISVSTIYFDDTNNWSANTLINDYYEESAGTFTVTGGTYHDSTVSFPTFYDIIYSNNRGGDISIYYGYKIYKTSDSSVVATGYISSTSWIGGIGEYASTLNGYNGYFDFTAPVESSTEYELKWFVEIDGYSYSTGTGDILYTSFGVNTPAISATKSVDVVELTNSGIQIATGGSRYIKLERNAGAPILTGQGKITLIGDGSNPILGLSGTTGGTAIDIAASTGKIAMNGNNIELGSGAITWNPGANSGTITTYSDSGIRPAIILTNVGSPGGGTIRGMEISLTTWRVGRNTSARRYKEEIEDWNHPSILDAINNVPIRTYYWKIDKDAEKRPQQIGIIAEELEAGGLEEYVDYDWFEDSENPEGPKQWLTSGIAKQELVFVLWKAVQELSQKVKDLENKLNS